jgi:hypothetical protein
MKRKTTRTGTSNGMQASMEFGRHTARPTAWRKGNDYSSVAYWYQTGQHAHHEGLSPVEERLPRRWPGHGRRDEQTRPLKSIANHKDVGER